MAEHAIAQEPAHGGTPRLYTMVWFGLVGLTFVEVSLAYMHLPSLTMLLMLVGLSVIKAGLIMAYFMHLRFERFSLVLWLIPALLFCIGMLTVVYPDSLRLFHMRIY